MKTASAQVDEPIRIKKQQGYLRAYQRGGGRRVAFASPSPVVPPRFTISIGSQRARLTFMTTHLDEMGGKLLRQAINSAQRKGVKRFEIDLRQLNDICEQTQALILKTRNMLNEHVEFSVLTQDPAVNLVESEMVPV